MVVSASPWCVPFCEFEVGFKGVSAAFRRQWRHQNAQMSSISLNITMRPHRCPNTLHELCIRIVGASVWREHILIVRRRVPRHVFPWAGLRGDISKVIMRGPRVRCTHVFFQWAHYVIFVQLPGTTRPQKQNLKMIHFRFRVSCHHL